MLDYQKIFGLGIWRCFPPSTNQCESTWILKWVGTLVPCFWPSKLWGGFLKFRQLNLKKIFNKRRTLSTLAVPPLKFLKWPWKKLFIQSHVQQWHNGTSPLSDTIWFWRNLFPRFFHIDWNQGICSYKRNHFTMYCMFYSTEMGELTFMDVSWG